MSTSAWIVVAFVAFLASVVVVLRHFVRSMKPMPRSDRILIAIGLSGFVFHALLFFSGAILYSQLAFLAVVYFVVLMPLKQPRGSTTPDRRSSNLSK